MQASSAWFVYGRAASTLPLASQPSNLTATMPTLADQLESIECVNTECSLSLFVWC